MWLATMANVYAVCAVRVTVLVVICHPFRVRVILLIYCSYTFVLKLTVLMCQSEKLCNIPVPA